MVGDSIPEKNFNISIKYNLQEFTKNSSRDIANTIPAFNLLDYKIGCLNGSNIDYVSDYALKKSICSSDVRSNIKEITEFMLLDSEQAYSDYNKQTLEKAVIEKIDESNEKRNCFIHKDVKCASDKIVAYKKNIIFYLEQILISIFFILLFVLILQVVYFKGFIYIIYGNKYKN
jgi:hypothetical protein